jgi:hypothetical protein
LSQALHSTRAQDIGSDLVDVDHVIPLFIAGKRSQPMFYSDRGSRCADDELHSVVKARAASRRR